MITVTMSAVIDADRQSVWRALTTPSELIRWDDRILELLDPAPGYPRPGQHIRWRYRLGTVPIVMHDRPLEVSAYEKLRSKLSLGLLSLESTHTLAINGDASKTRLSLKVLASNSVPVVGGTIDRFDIRRIATEFIDTRLRSLKEWVEDDANRREARR